MASAQAGHCQLVFCTGEACHLYSLSGSAGRRWVSGVGAGSSEKRDEIAAPAFLISSFLLPPPCPESEHALFI